MGYCTNCGSSNISVNKTVVPYEYKGSVVELTLPSTICSDCGDEYVSAEQIKESDNLFRRVRAEADGLLLPEEIKELRKSLGYTQQEAAQIFGGGARAFGKYERGEVYVSSSMNSLMLVARDVPGVMDYLLKKAGIKPKVLKTTQEVIAEITSQKPEQKHLDFITRRRVKNWISDSAANDMENNTGLAV